MGLSSKVGALVELDEKTRFGFAYLSEIDYTAEGDADYTVPVVISGIPALDGGIQAAFTDVAAKADLTLPASASASVYHRFNSSWAAMADVTWTEWSSFDELRVQFADGRPVAPDSSIFPGELLEYRLNSDKGIKRRFIFCLT